MSSCKRSHDTTRSLRSHTTPTHHVDVSSRSRCPIQCTHTACMFVYLNDVVMVKRTTHKMVGLSVSNITPIKSAISQALFHLPTSNLLACTGKVSSSLTHSTQHQHAAHRHAPTNKGSFPILYNGCIRAFLHSLGKYLTVR